MLIGRLILERNLANVELMGRLLVYVLVFVNFSYSEWGRFLKHCISLNKLPSVCTGGEPFQRCEFDKTFSKHSRLIITENAPWKGSTTKVFWYPIYCTQGDPYQGEDQWSLGTCQAFSQCYRLTRFTFLSYENIFIGLLWRSIWANPCAWEPGGFIS